MLFCYLCGFNTENSFAQSKNNLLAVVVMVQGKNISLKGYCIYVKDGKEIREELTTDNTWGWNFRGDYIKEVEMQKISGDAAFQLYIMEGKDAATGKPVFESELVNSGKQVFYKKKMK